jgi:hypothetical protein
MGEVCLRKAQTASPSSFLRGLRPRAAGGFAHPHPPTLGGFAPQGLLGGCCGAFANPHAPFGGLRPPGPSLGPVPVPTGTGQDVLVNGTGSYERAVPGASGGLFRVGREDGSAPSWPGGGGEAVGGANFAAAQGG